MKITTGAVITVMLLAGCSSTTGQASPTPTPSTAPNSQFASIIAGEQRDFAEAAANMDECKADPAAFVCAAQRLTVTLKADTLLVKLNGAATPGPGNQLYIGPPSTEIESLIADTAEELEVLRDAAEAASDACDGTATEACYDAQIEVSAQATDVLSAFDAWGPYS